MTRGDSTTRLDELIRANSTDVLAWLERRIDPRADAADVLSDAFIVAWNSAHRAPADEIGGRIGCLRSPDTPF